jgi:hypothetical protein
MRKLSGHLTYANVMSTLAVFLVIGGGVAYAANTVFSSDIVDGEVKTDDLDTESVTSAKLKNSGVHTLDVDDDAVTAEKIATGAVASAEVLDASLSGIDVSNSSLTGDDVASSSLTGIDVANSSLTSSDVLDETLGTADIGDGGLNTSDLAISSITGSRIAASAVTTSDIANRTVNADDLDAADRSGSIDVGAISNGRCATITGNVSGAEPGDVAMLTTNGSIPNGMVIYAQRALTDQVHIKVCNLTGATSAAITDLPVRVVTIH